MVRKKITTKTKKAYGVEEIEVLRGLAPVRKRPAMYIGSTGADGLHHLINEVVANSVDEAMVGYCDQIEVTFLPHNRVEVRDNGRGIPIEIHPQTKKSALETVMTYLHAGAKFGGKTYRSVGGLHGVGVSVVCALSRYLRAQVCVNGYEYYQEYAAGRPQTKIQKSGKCEQTGTTIVFEPDPRIFKEINWNVKRIINYLRQIAYLVKGVRITFRDQRQAEPEAYTFYFEGGLASYVRYLTRGRTPRHPNLVYLQEEREGIAVEAAFLYTQEYESYEESFANNICTPEGGTHLTGLRMALTRVLNDYARRENLLKDKDENLSGSDIREGLTAVVSVKVPDPQFEGQTKRKLGNPEVRGVTNEVVAEHLSRFLEENPRDGREIIGSCLLAQKARKAAKSARETIFKKGISRGLTLPGKLADCSNRKPEDSELYIVEGISAGGSTKMARDRRFQAVLPTRGKILNVEKARLDKILASEEIKAMIIALGTAIAEEFNLDKIRYHRIIIMADSDVDGSHIRTLLLTLFYRYFKPVIDKGYLYIARPPLYRIQTGKTVEYGYSDEDRDQILGGLKKKKEKISIQRYKGLGEMNATQLWETTMDPAKRTLFRVTIEDAKEADRIFDVLMGEEVLPRKRFIQAYAKQVKNLDI